MIGRVWRTCRWECKYHVVFIPKFRRKILYGQLRQQVGRILRELCDQRGVELIEGKAMKGGSASTFVSRRNLRQDKETWTSNNP